MPPRTLVRFCFFAVAIAFATRAFAQTVTWTGATDLKWFTATNWSNNAVPSGIPVTISLGGSPYTITTNGASSNVNVTSLNLTSSSASLLFDFSSSGFSVNLGTGASTWSAGLVELQKASGLFGNGTANTSLSIGSGVQLLYSTFTGTRSLNSLTLSNSGTVQVTSGFLSVNSVALTNQSGGVVHANGAEIDFNSSTSITNLGTIRATGSSGKLVFNGTYTTTNLGTIDLVSGGHAYLGGTINNAANTLNAPSGGSFEVLGGTITGGTIASGALTFTNSGGFLDGASLSGNLTLPNNAYIRFKNGATFTGSTMSLGTNSGLYWQQVGTLSGKSITFGAGGYIYVNGVNNALTIGNTTTATGDLQIYTDGSSGTSITNQGTLTHTNGSSQIYSLALTNSGSITATGGTLQIGSTSSGYNTTNSGSITVDGSSTTINVDGNLTNSGTLTAQNSGSLVFRGTNTTAHLGNVTTINGGHAYLNGTLDNTASLLNAPTGGSFELLGGTILGGTIANTAISLTTSGGYLDGATVLGDVTLPSSTYVRLLNGSTFTGTNATFAPSAGVYWQQIGTLSGKALAFGSNSYIYINGVNNALTFDSATTATGELQIYSDGSNGTTFTNQGTLTHTAGSGSLNARTFNNSGNITATGGSLVLGSTNNTYTTNNSGTVTSSGASAAVYLDGTVVNTGTLKAQNSGELVFRGTNTTANLGTVQLATSGHAYFNGTLNNAASTLNAPTGGSFELLGGTITGGTIAAGALTFTSSGGYLDNTIFSGNFSLPASTYVRLTNNTSVTGANITLANSAGIYWQQASTLSGKALTFGAGSYIYVNGVNSTLTLNSLTTATGELQLYTDGSAGTAITNQGTLTHTSGFGQIYSLSLTNSGSISATAGTLQIGSTSNSYLTSNSGTITADGASTTIDIDGNVTNTGTLTAQNSGHLVFRGTNSTGNLGNVQIASGGHAYLQGTLVNTTLNAPTGGVFELQGGTISGGTISAGALTFTGSGGYLDNSTFTGDISLPSSSYVRFINNSVFTGGNLTFGTSAGLYWQQTGTLSNKALTFGAGSYIYVNGVNNTLTLDSLTTATGELQLYTDGSSGTAITNQGTLTHTSGFGQIYSLSLTNGGNITATGGTLQIGSTSSSYNTSNTGTILADGSSTTVNIDGNVTNTGTLKAQNSGRLVFRGTNSTGNLGNVQIASSGHAYLQGTLINANLTAPTGGIFELQGGTISGGTIGAGALTFTGSGGYLDGATFLGDITLPLNAYVRFINNATITGTNFNFGSNAGLYWQQVGTLSSKALTFGNGGYIYVNGTNNTLTLDALTTGTGELQLYTDGSNGTSITNQGTLTHTSGFGQIYARSLTNSGNITATGGTLQFGLTSSGYNSTNSGTITVDGSSTTINVDGNVTNTGTLKAQNSGSFVFRGTNATGNLGTVQIASGGHAYLQGTLTNTTLNAPSGGTFELLGGTISGGTVSAGALGFTSSGGYLDGVTVNGDLTFSANSYVRILNNTSLLGNNFTFGSNAGLYWQQASTLASKALSFASGGYIYVNGVNNTLTLDSATTATGNINLYSDGSAGTAITNQGTLTHNTGSGNLYAMSFTNSGTIVVSSGSMSLGTSTTGATIANNVGATIRQTGGNIFLQTPSANPLVNQGTIDVQGGTFFTSNHLTNGANGAIKGAGIINGGLILAGGAIMPGNSGIGTLTFSSGTLTVTGASVLNIDLSGTTSDKLLFLNPSSVVNIGSGILALNLNLLGAPTQNTTFSILSIGSGGSGITGSFAGLPNNGDTISATFGAISYGFSVNYQPNLVTLTFIPEPSTYALMGLGLAVVGAAYRRRRNTLRR